MTEMIEIPFKEEYIPEISQLLAHEYLTSNLCFKTLNLEEETLRKEFAEYFRNKSYEHLILFADKQKFEQGQVSFVTIGCGGDILSYFPQNELNYLNNIDFNLVPTLGKMRQYMRYKCLQPLWQDYKPQKGQLFFGTTMFINPLYQGQGNAYKMFYQSYKRILSFGYQYFVGNVVNDKLKPVLRRAHLVIPEYQVKLDDMEIQDSKTKPLQGANLTQSVFVLDLQKSLDNFQDIAYGPQIKPKL